MWEIVLFGLMAGAFVTMCGLVSYHEYNGHKEYLRMLRKREHYYDVAGHWFFLQTHNSNDETV